MNADIALLNWQENFPQQLLLRKEKMVEFWIYRFSGMKDMVLAVSYVTY